MPRISRDGLDHEVARCRLHCQLAIKSRGAQPLELCACCPIREELVIRLVGGQPLKRLVAQRRRSRQCGEQLGQGLS